MRPVIACLCLLLCLPAAAAAASGAGAINLQFNTSARHAGMGGAGVGAPWGADTDHWANPALLAFRPGIQYLDFRSELARGLADDIVLTNEELTIGAYGVTLLLARGPVQGNFLDMGTQIATDENGQAVGSFESYMAAESWGVGVDLVQLADRALDRDLQRHLSLAVGFVRRDFEDRLAPDSILQDTMGGGGAAGEVSDRGVVLRVTPLPGDEPAGWNGNGYVGVRADLGWGTSRLAYAEDFIVHVDTDQADPWPRTYASGWSVRLSLPLAPDYRDRPRRGLGRLVTAAIDPLFQFSWSTQTLKPGFRWTGTEYEYEINKDKSQEERGDGWEIGLLNTVFIRRGHLEMPWGDIDGDTRGWGVNLQAGRYGGFRWDKARVPQAQGLPHVYRESWAVWVDPVALFAAGGGNSR